MKMIDPAMGWFEIVEVSTYDLDKITGCNDEFIDKSSSRVSQFLNMKWISRYHCP